jgi:nicotinate-nucleotide adenylyltransferase
MNIAILGGRFDPPHVWHFWTAQQVLENVKGIEQVWLMPDYSNAFKPIVADVSDRIEMLHALETGRIRLSTIAAARQELTYTINVVQDLVKDPHNTYSWIIGSDILSEFNRWREYQKLSRLIKFLVIPRKDFPIKSLPSEFSRIQGDWMMSNVSSSLIRQRVKNGQTIAGLVFPQVAEIIMRKNLYK